MVHTVTLKDEAVVVRKTEHLYWQSRKPSTFRINDIWCDTSGEDSVVEYTWNGTEWDLVPRGTIKNLVFDDEQVISFAITRGTDISSGDVDLLIK